MSFLKTFFARPLAWLVALAVGAGGGIVAYIVAYLNAAKEGLANSGLGGVEILIVGGLIGVLAKFFGALGAKYFPKPLVPPVEPEPEPPSADYKR